MLGCGGDVCFVGNLARFGGIGPMIME